MRNQKYHEVSHEDAALPECVELRYFRLDANQVRPRSLGTPPMAE